MKKDLWFRCYVSILDPDDKTQDLSDKLFRKWMYLLAAYRKSGGVMPDGRALARCLRVKIESTGEILKALEDAALLDRVDGILHPHDWDELQFESDTSSNRVRAFRERRMKQLGNVSETVNETTLERPQTRASVQSTEIISEPPMVPRGGPVEIRKAKAVRKPKDPKPEDIPESDEFVEFYRLYWRHDARDVAWISYQREVHGPVEHAKVMAAIRAQMPAMMSKEWKGRPQPATWLNQHRWRDQEGIAEHPGFLFATPTANGNGNGNSNQATETPESKRRIIAPLTPPVRKVQP